MSCPSETCLKASRSRTPGNLMSVSHSLLEKIESRQAVVSVIGLGYTGLPLAVVFAEAGFRVIGIDVDKQRVESINRRESYVQDVAPERLTRLSTDGPVSTKEARFTVGGPASGQFSATSDYDALREADAVIICVPTPLSKTRDPDVSQILSAADGIATRMRPGMLIVLESTTYPGTTHELVLPSLQSERDPPLAVGKDFFLAFSPERIDPGQTRWTISNTPKVIGGMTPRCHDAAKALYECVVEEVVTVSTPMVAEMVKLLENTFRATNIGLVNEIAIMCDRLGIDVWEVIEAAKTKPFGFMPFYPGPGLGGHCIPVDPNFLAWKLKTLNYNARFIQLAEEINLAMPQFWVTKVQDALNEVGKPINGSTILVLGVTYKRDVGDARESPALDIIDTLLNKGAGVSYHDPYIGDLKTDTYELSSIEDSELKDSLANADCVVIVTDHSGYDWNEVRQSASLTVDTRHAIGAPSTPAEAEQIDVVAAS